MAGHPDLYNDSLEIEGVNNNEPLPEHLEQYCQSIFGWTCLLCGAHAASQLYVQHERNISGYSVYKDYDGKKWVRCVTCRSTFHFHCATNKTIQQVKLQPFKCSFNKCDQYDD